MMMLEEEQISFRSASPMFDGVEDYSHQIAEMIGLRNESNFREVGVCILTTAFFCISSSHILLMRANDPTSRVNLCR